MINMIVEGYTGDRTIYVAKEHGFELLFSAPSYASAVVSLITKWAHLKDRFPNLLKDIDGPESTSLIYAPDAFVSNDYAEFSKLYKAFVLHSEQKVLSLSEMMLSHQQKPSFPEGPEEFCVVGLHGEPLVFGDLDECTSYRDTLHNIGNFATIVEAE